MPRSRRILWWALFGVGLLVAITGWLWILQRLVQSEAEIAESRVRVAEERYLSSVAEGLRQHLEDRMEALPAREQTLPLLARTGESAGIWFEPTPSPPLSSERKARAKEWQQRLRSGNLSGSALDEALKSGTLEWGWVEDGRDLVAGILLAVIRREGPSGPLTRHLQIRVWDYSGPPLKPAFRAVLIRELLKEAPEEPLERLLEAELIRIAEGRPEAREGLGPYEALSRDRNGREVVYFWNKSQLEAIVNRDRPEHLTLESTAPGEATGVPISFIERWPVLTLRSEMVVGHARRLGEMTLFWVGGLTGLLVLGLALLAAFMAHRELRLAKLRTDLAASVAHELRTPLAGQRLLLESLMERGDLPQHQQAEYIGMAFRENKRLSRLAEEFLTFSRLERGVLVLEEESVAVTEVVTHAVDSLREKWADPECRLTIAIDDDLPLVCADSEALTTVLRNLLENAWKYSERPRVIEVLGRKESGGVLFTVRDNGVGIPSRDRERIFRQFYRVDQGLSRSREGLGLGLSIVKRLVSAMGGRIEVDSEKGAGSEFRIWLKEES